MIPGSAFNMTYPTFSFVPVNYCVCVNLFFWVGWGGFFCFHVWDVCFSQGYSEKDNVLITTILENVNHDTCHVTISRGPCSPRPVPTPLFASSCFLRQPQQPFPPSEQSHTGNCFSLCKTEGWKRIGGVRTNAQRLGLPKAHGLPTERHFLPQRQS